MSRRIAVFSTVLAALALAGVVAVASGVTGDHDRSTVMLRGERDLVHAGTDSDDRDARDAETKAKPAGAATTQVWPGVAPGVVVDSAAPGWAGETLVDPVQDDWEPAVAFDPNGTYAYMLTTRYSAPKACGNCPKTVMWLLRSTDNGVTWNAGTYLCKCPGTGSQNDPQIEVASDGSVDAVWMDDYKPGVVFARSTDHGLTWSAPLAVLAKSMHFTDKPILAISPSGKDVYIGFNSSDSFIVASHNYGASFSAPVKTNGSDGRYYFAGGGQVLPNGSVVFAESSFTQTSTGDVFVHVMRSTDGGATWTQIRVATTPQQPLCVAAGCPADFYGTIPALARDATGKLALSYTGPTVAAGPQRPYVIRSSDGGVTWSAPVDVGGPAGGAGAGFTAITGTGSGDFRMFFMDSRAGVDAWNTYYRRSTDGGATWSAEVKISDATSGPSYVTPTGFQEPYGDYGQIRITAAGVTYAVWGEGPNYTGPGGCWYNRTLT